MKKIFYLLTFLVLSFTATNVKAAEIACESFNCAYSCGNKTIALSYEYNGVSSKLPKVYEATIKDGVLSYNTDSSGILAKGITVSNNGSKEDACTCPTSISFDGNTVQTGSDCKQTSYSKISVDKNKTDGKTSYDKIACGDVKMPYMFPKYTAIAINILQIITPIIIIILGSLDLVKAVMAGKEDEIKKGQQTFIKRLVVGACVFVVFIVVKALLSVIAPPAGEYANMWSCIDCFVTGECETVIVK